MPPEKVTPSRQQYLDMRAQYPDCILFFRMGDFYETFDDHAELCARELEIILTRRQEVPMAGVPYHAVEGYLATLVAKGYKVAVAEQVGDSGSGLMERRVTRVVTAGTITEPGMLDARRNNYLVALLSDEKGSRAGLAYLDLTTGEFACTQISGTLWQRWVAEEIERLAPAEIIEPATDEGESVGPQRAHTDERGYRHTPFERWHWELGRATRTLESQFGVATLEAFGVADKPLAIRAAGAALAYVRESLKRDLPQLDRLVCYSTRGYMTLDAATRRNLELTDAVRGDPRYSLLGVLDRTQTPMGARLLRQWVGQPLLHRDVLEARLDAVAALHEQTVLRLELLAALRGLADIERITNRAITGTAQPRDLGTLRASLHRVPGVQRILAGLLRAGIENPPEPLHPDDLDPCEEVAALLDAALVEEPPAAMMRSGFIQPSHSQELSDIIEKARHAREWIAGLQETERARTGIPSLKVAHNKVFGYYIEVTHANAKQIPADYERRQTLVNAERYVTTELKEYESLVFSAEERQLELERRLFDEIVAQVAAASERLLRLARALGHLDAFVSLAEVAVQYNYVRPTLTDERALHIVQGRHPTVERALGAEPYIPNDTHLTEEACIHLITGPNMSGKSSYLRQTALIVLMAQIGSFVPAARAEIGLVDRIFTRVGAQDEITRGQSTFMVEMVETANLLSQGTGRSLFILDEVGRGTSTYDGLAIARAVIEYIHNHPKLQTRTLFATHYHELVVLESLLPRVVNYRVAVAEEGERVIFLHRVERGSIDRSYGIHVAQIAGMPRAVVRRARELLAELEQGSLRAAPVEALPLFAAAAPSPVEQRLRALDVNHLTPIEALSVLYELRAMAGEEAEEREG